MWVKATDVGFDEERVWVTLEDERIIGVPLKWFPRLEKGTPAQRDHVVISPFGLHWPELDEDLMVAPLLCAGFPHHMIEEKRKEREERLGGS